MPKPIYIINGPNLNLLGQREPEIYGSQTLADIEKMCADHAESLGHSVIFMQSNIEGELVDAIQDAGKTACAIVINYDAIKAVDIPVIEVHLSQPHSRESFRHTSYVSQAAKATISGMGAQSYILGLDAAVHALTLT